MPSIRPWWVEIDDFKRWTKGSLLLLLLTFVTGDYPQKQGTQPWHLSQALISTV